MNAALWIRRFAAAGVLLCLVVVVLGAYVRLTAAGLGCPDWPGCYGHVTPAGAAESLASQAAYPATPLDVGKAWREMVHRYAAGTLGFLVVLIAALAIAARDRARVSVRYALVLLAVVVLQGILGMLTVTWQLKPLAVTLHLLGGLTALALLWWLWLSVRRAPDAGAAPSSDAGRSARTLVIVGLAALGAQIALGGWTSSNYAAVACPDFPTCQNEWWPQTDYRDAFVLWRGLGINYEGGVLEHPARVAIHFTHRLGAVVASLALLLAAVAVLRQTVLVQARGPALAVLGALGLQLAIGILMVVNAFPLSLATAHNAGAALLVLAAVALLWHTWRGS
ncbi:MAG TPA: COX15/CtaA family protein [Steroidobacteraceae bacterium]|nr:COX15/CtaA family protein [Steroidobacteraceae bacterium]